MTQHSLQDIRERYTQKARRCYTDLESEVDSIQLCRLIHLLLEAHPNAFSLAAAASSPLPANDSTSILTVDDFVALDIALGLGLGKEERDFSWDWTDVLRTYVEFSPANAPVLPPAIRAIISHVRASSVSRDPIHIPISVPSVGYSSKKESQPNTKSKVPPGYGMSPKKAHEVTRMAQYVASVAWNITPSAPLYIVDVGAGQGHLARALLKEVPGAGVNLMGILALDGDGIIVEREQEKTTTVKASTKTKGSDSEIDSLGQLGRKEPIITHKLGHITSAQALVDVVDEWMSGMTKFQEDTVSQAVIPVILVSLHGCGSLSLDVLRASLLRRYPLEKVARQNPPPSQWGFIACITVPCCYNLLREEDRDLSNWNLYQSFSATSIQPQSQSTSSRTTYHSHHTSHTGTDVKLLPTPLPPSAYHLAAQIPEMWVSSQLPSTIPSASSVASETNEELTAFAVTPAAALAVRKVVWRALLERVLVESDRSQSSLAALPTNSDSSVQEKVGLGSTSALCTRRPAFIPPMKANAYLASANTRASVACGDTADQSIVLGEGQANGSLAGDTVERVGKLNQELGLGGRIGRLPSRAYESWDAFLKCAGQRLGRSFSSVHPPPPPDSPSSPSTALSSSSKFVPLHLHPLARALSILHTLRCILGPLVESKLLEDRVEGVRSALEMNGSLSPLEKSQFVGAECQMGDVSGESDPDEGDVHGKESSGGVMTEEYIYKTSLVPLFSQHGMGGSARNMAVVILPTKSG